MTMGLIRARQPCPDLATIAGKLLTGVVFYPFFGVMPILVAAHRWPGIGQFFRDALSNKNGFWNALVRAESPLSL